MAYVVQESRILKFWFLPETDYFEKVTGAYDFFKELIRPESFPRGWHNIQVYIKVLGYRYTALWSTFE